ncbi:hypothetical protein GJ496_008887 [Pomphorhynchus laevis]|nr:hypothetical protein GJ496_008887 [Pomphorhynchus laevis]
MPAVKQRFQCTSIASPSYTVSEDNSQIFEWINSLSDEALSSLDHVHNYINILIEMQPTVKYTISTIGVNQYNATVFLDGVCQNRNSWSSVASRPLLAKFHASRELVFYLIDMFSLGSRRNRFCAQKSNEYLPNSSTIDDQRQSFSKNCKSPINISDLSAVDSIKMDINNGNIQDDKTEYECHYQNENLQNPQIKKHGIQLDAENDIFDPGFISADGTSISIGERTVTLVGKGPMAILNEVYPNLVYEMLLERGKCALETFTCRINLNGFTFTGNGRSKKLARSNAALSVLERLYGKKFNTLQRSVFNDTTLPESMPTSASLQTFVDGVASLVKDKFESLVADDPVLQKRKVLAGIVITRHWQLDTARVLCVTTGTKCLNAERLSAHGKVLKDCHAEILARRCLVKYLYENLFYFAANNEVAQIIKSDHIILEPNREGDGYRIQSDVEFHIFVSTSPCGDGRVFSIHEGDQNDGNDVHPNRKARGQLRKKIEAGEGTVLINPGPYIQTWDAVISGEPLQTMSCSDKMCRWNITGIQGSLLSCYIEPVYLSSVIVGNLFHADHLRRALYGRIENHVPVLPANYKMCKPLLARVSYSLPRLPRKAPFTSFIWYEGVDVDNPIQEVINAESGNLENGEMSQFARCSLFALWKKLKYVLPMQKSICTEAIQNINSHLLYADSKLLSTDYAEAKNAVSKAFAKAGLGIWVSKPCEQDLFE